MDGLLKKFPDLKIELGAIKNATNNFDDRNNLIGYGGFGRVYKGEVSHSQGRGLVAIKRLDRSLGQGEAEFLNEIDTLSRYRHKNLISLVGFCYQGDEAILVYELASRGSLDKYLDSPNLTWSKRIKICLDAAKGLRHLHDPRGTHQRLIHCDVKCGNILLDDHWTAKIADFGFSIMGPANELQSTVVTLAAGTQGYIDPLYQMTNTLTKESDVYSFGVVLVEVLCGALCYADSNDSVQYSLVSRWKRSYEEENLNHIIFKNPTIQPLYQTSLQTFSNIAYRCLNESREGRPKMAEVVTELETALRNQEFKAYCYEEIFKSAQPPPNYRSEDELMMVLSKGVLLNGGKTYFSVNEKGEHCEMISSAECVDPYITSLSMNYNSRFVVGAYQLLFEKFQTHVKPQFLSSGITYKVNLIFKFLYPPNDRYNNPLCLKSTLQGETENSISHHAYEREDGWWACELCEFSSHNQSVDLQILISVQNTTFLHVIGVEGIEFRPSEKQRQHKQVDKKQPSSNSHSYTKLKEKLPTDYKEIMKRSKIIRRKRTKKMEYSIMTKGFLIDNDKMKECIWFYLDKNGKKCHMLSAKTILNQILYMYMQSLPKSRFGEVFMRDAWRFYIEVEVESQLVSSETTYAGYLVYKLPKDQSGLRAPVEVKDEELATDFSRYIYLVSPPKVDQNTHDPSNRPKVEYKLPNHREDDWMEVQVCEFQTSTTTKKINIHLQLSSCDHKKLSGLIIQGLEFRPI